MAAQSGAQLMMTSALKALGLDPEQVMKTIEDVRTIAVTCGTRLAAIEERQDHIIELLEALTNGHAGHPEQPGKPATARERRTAALTAALTGDDSEPAANGKAARS